MLLSRVPYAQDSKERLQLVDSVINCIVKLNLPLSLVDEPAFIQMMAAFNNKVRIPCRQTLSKTLIPAKASAAKAILKENLSTVDYCSLTCDGWTSNGSHSYLGILFKFNKRSLKKSIQTFLIQRRHCSLYQTISTQILSFSSQAS